jgi:thioredoxin reductase (NADPH)
MEKIKMYGTQQCSDCNRAKQYLNAENIEYEFIDISKVEGAAQEVMAINGGKRVVPTFIINSKSYSNPNNIQLKEILNSKN